MFLPGVGSTFVAGNTLSKIAVGDFNGDGLDDVIGFGLAGPWFTAFSTTPFGFTTFETTLSALGAPKNTVTDYFVGDYNRDGRDDVAIFNNDGDLRMAFSNGLSMITALAAQFQPINNWAFFLNGDFDGDGRPDFGLFSLTGIVTIRTTD